MQKHSNAVIKSKKNEKKWLKDLIFDVLAECSSFFEWVRLSKFRVLYTPLQWSEMVAVVGFVLAEGLRVRVRVRSCERERERQRCIFGFEKWKGYYGNRMSQVCQFYDVQHHGSKNTCTLINGSNGQISLYKLSG